MKLIRAPPSEFELEKFRFRRKDMYIEHPYFYNDKYFAKVDGKFIEITKEVAYAMNNFYRSSKPKKVEVKNKKGEVIEKVNSDIVNIALHFFLKDVRPMQPLVMNRSIAVS